MSNAHTRIAVTGLGIMTALGLNYADNVQGLRIGRSLARRFRQFDSGSMAAGFGYELPEAFDALALSRIKTHARRQMTRATMIGVLCAEDALNDSDILKAGVDRKRIGVVCGTTGTGYIEPQEGEDPQRILKNMTNAPASWISIRNGLEGPASSVSTACSSGAYALNTAVMYLLTGQCDAVVCGSSESIINTLDVGGFASLMAISTFDGEPAQACKPFDLNRDGFVMGEGGGMLVLERFEHAQKRGAKIYAETWLPGLSSEAYSIMSPQNMGTGMADCMGRALDNAGLSADSIDYINAHGTATTLNDLYETKAIESVFGTRAKSLMVSSTKSLTGHILSGAAGVEAVISVIALYEKIVPPTVNLTCADPELDLDYVAEGARSLDLQHVMSNSFAFGGHNGVCIFGRGDCKEHV